MALTQGFDLTLIPYKLGFPLGSRDFNQSTLLAVGCFFECPAMAWTWKHSIKLTTAGAHILKVRLKAKNCLLEKVVNYLGEVQKSFCKKLK